jgi:hypothetical protein
VAVTGYDGAVTERAGGGALPSSDDQSVDMPTSADPVRQREPDPIVAKLRERMERLPHGHPSSPYNDDGSRKPPPPGLSQYELPIPGDPDYRPEPSGASDADGPEAGQTSERATPGTHADDGPETTTDRPELWEAPPDVEPASDAEYAGHGQEVREEPDQVWAWGLAPNEEDTPGVRDEVSREEGETVHDSPADDLDERAANDIPMPRDDDYGPEPSRASEAEGPTDEEPARAGDRQHADGKAAADEPAPDSEDPRPSDSEDEPRSDPDGSWKWKGRFLSPEEAHSSDQALARLATAEGRDADGNYGEHGLTPAMRRIEAQLEHAELVPDTEKFALKGADRFKEKVARDKETNPDKSIEEVISEIHDAVRYTFILAVDEYYEAYWAAENKLNSEGYELQVRRNMWANLEYKGINSRWQDPGSGLPFEVQFHTQASWEAKQQTHAAYEKIEDVRTPDVERERLREQQKEISAKVPEPPLAMEIPDYRKKV